MNRPVATVAGALAYTAVALAVDEAYPAYAWLFLAASLAAWALLLRLHRRLVYGIWTFDYEVIFLPYYALVAYFAGKALGWQGATLLALPSLFLLWFAGVIILVLVFGKTREAEHGSRR